MFKNNTKNDRSRDQPKQNKTYYKFERIPKYKKDTSIFFVYLLYQHTYIVITPVNLISD